MKNTLLSVPARDGYPLEAMLSVPEGVFKKLVLFVNGSGPMTYHIKRQLPDGRFFNLHDLYAEEFTRRGIAYCRYSTRGAKDGDTAPYFVDIDYDAYRTYLPHNSVGDIECLVDAVRAEYPDISVYLLGWSEGSVIAPRVALNGRAKIDGLLLCGYCNENLHDTLVWQLQGNNELISSRRLFDYDRKGYISKADFEKDRLHVRQELFGEKTFEQLDLDGDGKLTAEDFAPRTIDFLNGILSAVERGDDEWTRQNHALHLTTGWFREHFSLEPNKTLLPRLDLPIHIFSGEYDAMTPQFYAEDIEKRFAELGKTNLTVHYFENHDHDLNCLRYFIKGELPDGIQCLLETAETL